jgi:DNA helicase-2/ATP-dependent DNA helicase PcrA
MLSDFLALMETLQLRAAEEPAPVVIDGVLEAIDYDRYLEKAFPGESEDRLENVRALVSAAAEHEKEAEEAGERATLHGFLDRSALVSDADEVGREPGVTLMTIHNAKGLEFPVVFLAGMEENLFPHARSTGNDEDLEEERRLCYVAMTRAKRRLFLSLAASRFVQGIPQSNRPSRFLDEIPDTVLAEERPAAPPSFLREPQVAWGSSAARTVRPAGPPPSIKPSGDMPADGFGIGRTVRHPMFGDGKITEREGQGPQLKLTIWFAGHGKKRILPSYTRLEVL